MNLRHFKPIKGFEHYLVSRRGKVWSVGRKQFIKHWPNNKGYMRVELWVGSVRNWRFVHRLVAIAFIPNPERKSQVNHKNWNRRFNWTKNLEWLTPSENIEYNKNKSVINNRIEAATARLLKEIEADNKKKKIKATDEVPF
jgi:hypothetical protein